MSAPTRPRNVVEWTAFAIGSALTLGVVAFLVWEAVSGAGRVDLRAEVASVVETPAGAEATVRVQNRGDASAQAVDVSVCDARGSCVPVSLGQIAAGATVEHVVLFESGTDSLTGRVVGWRGGR